MSRPAYSALGGGQHQSHQSMNTLNSYKEPYGDRPYSTSSLPSEREISDAYGYGGPVARGPKSAASKKRMWWGIGVAVLALVVIGGVVGGVVGALRKANNNSTALASNNGASTGGTASAAPSAKADPSAVAGGTTSGNGDAQFTLDSRLKKSFWGMAYTPPNAAYYPGCGDTIEGVVKDIQLISQLTTRIRLYGADCNQSAFVLDAIQRTQTNLSVYLGVYMDINDPTIYTRQLSTTLSVLRTFSSMSSRILGITVGNEILLQASSAGSSVATALADVTANIAAVRTAVSALSLPTRIPIGSGDAGSMITTAYAQQVDFLFSNNHPFFSGVGISTAADWTYNYMMTDTPASALLATNKPLLMQGEVGWPTAADAGGSLSLNGSAASIANSQTFLDTWVCQSNRNQTQYIYFEAFDEAWKAIYKGSEPYWGLFDKNRVFKSGLTIPDCAVTY